MSEKYQVFFFFNPIFVIRVEPCGLVSLTPQIIIVFCLTKIQKEKKSRGRKMRHEDVNKLIKRGLDQAKFPSM